MLDYAKLVAPSQHGGVLVAPDAPSCAMLARQNATQLNASQVSVLQSPLGRLRQETRERLQIDAARPVVVVGHQPDFIHAGVWAKNVFAHRLAEALQGVAVHLVVDSDAPKRLSIRVPATQDGRRVVHEVRMGALRAGSAYEQAAALTPAEIENANGEFERVLGSHSSETMVRAFLDAMKLPSSDWVTQVIAGRKQIESTFSVDLQDVRISGAWWSPLAVHLLLDSGAFALAYNAAIAEYRVQNMVRTPNRPIPDLAIEGDRTELPFWLYGDDRPRSRVFVTCDRKYVTLYAQSEPIGTFAENQILESDDVVELVHKASGWLLRPRALITTIWARLFLADLFIHGIGGAKYDRISDSIIANYFRLAAPDIACVTATLYLDPGCNIQVKDGSHESELRDARWNPQRHLAPPLSTEISKLLQQRTAAVQRSDELRHQRDTDRGERRRIFQHIHQISDQIHKLRPDLLHEAQLRTEQAQRQDSDRLVACNREYFFGLHTRSNLELLVSALPDKSDFVQSPLRP